MTMKDCRQTRKRLICLSIVAIVVFCALNVATATTSKYSTAIHSKIVTDATAQQPTTLTLTAPANATVDENFDVSGYLTAGGTGVSGRIINVQVQEGGQWKTFRFVTTDSNGFFTFTFIAQKGGDLNFRITYDGDSQYAPSVSNKVTVRVNGPTPEPPGDNRPIPTIRPAPQLIIVHSLTDVIQQL